MAPGAREKAANGAANPKARLGTFQGVFIPTSLNIFSILVFLRFGFILGQSGVIGFFGRSRSPTPNSR
jgi:solute carrier family 12 (potassium/chloride transporters), member 9